MTRPYDMLDTGEFCRLMLQKIPCNQMFTLDDAVPVLQAMRPEAFQHCASVRAKRITAGKLIRRRGHYERGEPHEYDVGPTAGADHFRGKTCWWISPCGKHRPRPSMELECPWPSR
jgi:hypothetical protein